MRLPAAHTRTCSPNVCWPLDRIFLTQDVVDCTGPWWMHLVWGQPGRGVATTKNRGSPREVSPGRSFWSLCPCSLCPSFLSRRLPCHRPSYSSFSPTLTTAPGSDLNTRALCPTILITSLPMHANVNPTHPLSPGCVAPPLIHLVSRVLSVALGVPRTPVLAPSSLAHRGYCTGSDPNTRAAPAPHVVTPRSLLVHHGVSLPRSRLLALTRV